MIDKKRIEKAVLDILYAVGEDPLREGLLDTPKRVANMYGEIFSGINTDPIANITTFKDYTYEEIVLVKDIIAYSMCEHHLLPFWGTINICYIPKNNNIIGLSKLARIIDALSKRPNIQEKLCESVAEALVEAIDAKGVYVYMEAEHTCMTMRGVKKVGCKTITIAQRGVVRSDKDLKNEIMMLMK